jgi:hypothetical protein
VHFASDDPQTYRGECLSLTESLRDIGNLELVGNGLGCHEISRSTHR